MVSSCHTFDQTCLMGALFTYPHSIKRRSTKSRNESDRCISKNHCCWTEGPPAAIHNFNARFCETGSPYATPHKVFVFDRPPEYSLFDPQYFIFCARLSERQHTCTLEQWGEAI